MTVEHLFQAGRGPASARAFTMQEPVPQSFAIPREVRPAAFAARRSAHAGRSADCAVGGLVVAAAGGKCRIRPRARARAGAGRNRPGAACRPPPLVVRAGLGRSRQEHRAERGAHRYGRRTPCCRRTSSRLFGGRNSMATPEGQGSGVIIDKQGYILTNNHVVDGASDMTVSLSDGRKVDAELMGGDPLTDLAVLKIDADGLIEAPWGTARRCRSGHRCGRSAIRLGWIAALRSASSAPKAAAAWETRPIRNSCRPTPRSIRAIAAGRWSTRRAGGGHQHRDLSAASYQGISFAIPSETAHEVYEQLRKGQPIVRGFLGVQLRRTHAASGQKARPERRAGRWWPTWSRAAQPTRRESSRET